MNLHTKIHIMHCGQVKVDRRLAYKTMDIPDVPPVDERSEQDQLCLPVSCYLIEHTKGNILIDVGWSEAIRSDPELALGSYAFMYCQAHQKARCQGIPVQPFSLDPIPFGPLKLGNDWYGDGSIYFVLTPGHTDGLISVLMRVQDGWVLLVSDAAYSEKSWREMILPDYTNDDNMAFQSLQWIREFSQRDDCVAIIANHDPLVMETSF